MDSSQIFWFTLLIHADLLSLGVPTYDQHKIPMFELCTSVAPFKPRLPPGRQLHQGLVKVSIGKAPPWPMKLTLNIDTITLQKELDEEEDNDVDSQARRGYPLVTDFRQSVPR